MKNQSECYQALLVGETLIKVDMTVRKLLNGELVDADDKVVLDEGFNFPDIWQIYRELKWYENIPDGGVLCRVCEQADWDEFEDTPRIIDEARNGNFYDSDGIGWPHAKPLTKQEIQVFMDNVLVEVGCIHNLKPNCSAGEVQYYKCTKCNHVQGYLNE